MTSPSIRQFHRYGSLVKAMLLSFLLLANTPSNSQSASTEAELITLPVVNRASKHHAYANGLLMMALEHSREKYGPFVISYESFYRPIQRQLQEVEKGELSVALSMPMAEWESKTNVVHFPLLKGLASYRLFLIERKNQQQLQQISSLEELKKYSVGQGLGWSTGKILQSHGFEVVYGSNYEGLFKMLHANRFQLLMRGVYEIEPELVAFADDFPALTVADGIAIHTYLPMYFCTTRDQPMLAQRLKYGLERAHTSGKIDQLFNHHFKSALNLLNAKQRKIFYLKNTNIDDHYFERDKPYLLDTTQH